MTDCLLRGENSCVRLEMSMLSPACESFMWRASMDVASLQDNNTLLQHQVMWQSVI